MYTPQVFINSNNITIPTGLNSSHLKQNKGNIRSSGTLVTKALDTS